MKYEEFYEECMLADIAKGRYPKKKVKEIFHKLCLIVAKRVEKSVFEYCWLSCLQTLHYEFGFGRQRLTRFFGEAAKAVEAFDAGAYSVEDMQQALKDDAHFEFAIDWGDEDATKETERLRIE